MSAPCSNSSSMRGEVVEVGCGVRLERDDRVVVGGLAERGADAAVDRGAEPAVRRVADDREVHVLGVRADDVPGAVGRAVVDDDHPRAEGTRARREVREQAWDVLGLVVGGDYEADHAATSSVDTGAGMSSSATGRPGRGGLAHGERRGERANAVVGGDRLGCVVEHAAGEGPQLGPATAPHARPAAIRPRTRLLPARGARPSVRCSWRAASPLADERELAALLRGQPVDVEQAEARRPRLEAQQAGQHVLLRVVDEAAAIGVDLLDLAAEHVLHHVEVVGREVDRDARVEDPVRQRAHPGRLRAEDTSDAALGEYIRSVATTGLKRSTWPTISLRPAARARRAGAGRPGGWSRSASRPARGARRRAPRARPRRGARTDTRP